MNRRERVIKALNHQEPDRVPVDLGSTAVSGIHREAYLQLVNKLKIKVGEPIMCDVMQQVALPDERVLELLGVDFRGLFFGDPDNNREIFFEDGTWCDEWGVYRKKPKSSFYYDLIKSPFEDDEITFKNIEEFNWPSPDDLGRIQGLREKAQDIRDKTDYAIVLNYPACIVHISQFMRGFRGWYEDLILNPGRLCEIFDRILNFYLEFGKHLFNEVRDYLDVVEIGDDISGQEGPVFSPKLYRDLIKPRHAELINFIRKQTKAKIMYHTCGTVIPFIEDLIEIGVDIINPVQPSARGMNTLLLKNEYGNRISFWGAIDTQRVLPYGNIKEVKNEVEKRIYELGRGGGYILSASHNIQPGVRPENVIAMLNHAREYGKYPLKQRY